jgi:hypothetical protein
MMTKQWVLLRIVFIFDGQQVSEVAPPPLHICPRGVSCGQLQANVKGITAVPYCACRKGKMAKLLELEGMAKDHGECPLRWDADDGKSITHGSNQYKVSEYHRPITNN